MHTVHSDGACVFYTKHTEGLMNVSNEAEMAACRNYHWWMQILYKETVLNRVLLYLWVFTMEVALCHSSGS